MSYMKLPIVIALACCFSAVEAASMSAERHRAPPGTLVGIELNAFMPEETVDMYFADAVQTQLVVDGAGHLMASMRMPVDAAPGKHWLSAIGRSSGERAQVPIRIETRWGQLGFGSDHKQYNPYENQLSASNIGSLAPYWSRAVNCALRSPVVVAYGFVLLGCRVSGLDAGLSAVNESSGTTHWSVVGSVDSQASVAVVNGKVFASAGRRRSVQVFDAKTGTWLWSRPVIGDVIASPVVADGRLFIVARSGTLYSIDAHSGHTTYWNRNIGTGLRISAAPAVAGGILYIGADNDHLLRAFDAQSGTPLWAAAVGGALPATPVVGNGKVYVAATDGNLYAFDARDGSPRWVIPVGFEAPIDERIAQAPALARGVLYMANSQGTLSAIRASDGSTLWTTAVGSRMFAMPVVANGLVYTATEDGRLQVFEAQTGALLHSQLVGGGAEALNGVVVGNGRVLVSADRRVYAFGLPISAASTDQ
jgi:outer membrane protein assembly factor BamB